MKYFDVFKARHKIYNSGGGIGIHNNIERESVLASDRYFTQIAGYKKAKLNFEEDLDIVTESTKTSLEKYIHLRHGAKVGSGDYITYTDNVDREDRTYIIRSVNYDQINPVAHGFFCNQWFKLHKDQEPILCYSNSTSYGNKGIIDVDSFNLLDSKTKIYVKKTDITKDIVLGTRIMFNNKYVYRITECDDVVFTGCYIIVAQRDETLVMDDFENNVAYNEDYKIPAKPNNPVQPNKVEIKGQDEIKIGREVEFTTDVDVVWSIDDPTSVDIVNQTDRSIKLKGLKDNWITLTATINGVIVGTKDIMVYK